MLCGLHTCGVTNSAVMHAARVQMISVTSIFRKPSTERSLLGAFPKLRKGTTSFFMSARNEQLGSHWTDFQEILYSIVFQKYAVKIQVSLKSDKNNGYFTRRPTCIYDNISPNSFK
jgi:hypothetical protein